MYLMSEWEDKNEQIIGDSSAGECHEDPAKDPKSRVKVHSLFELYN